MMHVSIQIRRWLMQTEVWRFVGSVSAVAGLICYALSSSFNHLFGKWNFLKIFIYFVFSFIIFLMTLFAKVWQCSTSTLFKTRMAVLVLIATTVYSYFYDKAVNEKPDVYILISCVAFAVMSLSLSKQTQCGCEEDLINCFLGCLIILLMKINVWLFSVGAGISYCLIILRSCSVITPQSEYFELQDQLAIQVDAQQANINTAIQVHSHSQQADHPIMTSGVSPSNGYFGLEHQVVNQVDSQFMACINAEKDLIFNMVLSLHVYKDSKEQRRLPLMTDFKQLLTDYNTDSLQIIHSLMRRNAAFENECFHLYISCRKEFLDKCLSILPLDFNTENTVEIRTERWMQASNVILRMLFPSERRLLNHVFFGFSSAADLSFVEICREFTLGLLSFPNNLAIGSSSLTHLRCSLKVFQTLTDFIPEFESLFSDASLMNEAITISRRLGEAIKLSFMELSNRICCDLAQKAAPNGGIDPITRHVKSRLSVVLEGRDTLEQVFKEYPMVGDREGTSSSFSIQMAQIMELLERNLEVKSKSYTNPAFGYVFMMNNCKYIVQRVKYSELAAILSDDWIRKHTTKFQQNLDHYQRTWDKVLDILKLDHNESVTLNVAADLMKEKLELFNKQFKEMCSSQSTWFVLDGQLREQLRISIQENLLPAYGNFIGRFQNLLGKHAYEYIEYGIHDIDALLNDLFRGSKIRSLKTGKCRQSKTLREKSD